VEVFGGAMWLYWMSKKLPVEKNVYNDFNRHLANVFMCSSTDTANMEKECLKLVKHIGDTDKFNEYRDEVFAVYDQKFPLPDYELAAKYMFLQLQIFSGGDGLTTKSKIYRMPEKYKPKFSVYIEKFSQPKYVERLNCLSTESMDCRKLITKYDNEDTFFYIDPPYFNLESYYTEDAFGRDDHIELLKQLRDTKGKWALSYYYFDELEDILPRDEFYWHEEKTFSINSTHRAERTELLIMNYKITSPLEKYF
jgi:DNA adenine methylase